ncbi:hypothetical protein AB4K20DRAFT_1865322 [Rhizopus microsporus]
MNPTLERRYNNHLNVSAPILRSTVPYSTLIFRSYITFISRYLKFFVSYLCIWQNKSFEGFSAFIFSLSYQTRALFNIIMQDDLSVMLIQYDDGIPYYGARFISIEENEEIH